MQRDAGAPAVGRRPDQQRDRDHLERQAQHGMRADHSEVDQDDDRGNWQPIADDGESPRVPGIAHEDQAAG